jgi:hypothetical protein
MPGPFMVRMIKELRKKNGERRIEIYAACFFISEIVCCVECFVLYGKYGLLKKFATPFNSPFSILLSSFVKLVV